MQSLTNQPTPILPQKGLKIHQIQEQMREKRLLQQKLSNVTAFQDYKKSKEIDINDRKKAFLQEERFTQIEKDNRLLLEKIMNIMVEKRDPSNRNRIKSLNFEKRKKEQSSIHEENLRLLNRISQKKSDYQKKSLDKQWNKTQKYSANLTFWQTKFSTINKNSQANMNHEPL